MFTKVLPVCAFLAIANAGHLYSGLHYASHAPVVSIPAPAPAPVPIVSVPAPTPVLPTPLPVRHVVAQPAPLPVQHLPVQPAPLPVHRVVVQPSLPSIQVAPQTITKVEHIPSSVSSSYRTDVITPSAVKYATIAPAIQAAPTVGYAGYHGYTAPLTFGGIAHGYGYSKAFGKGYGYANAFGHGYGYPTTYGYEYDYPNLFGHGYGLGLGYATKYL